MRCPFCQSNEAKVLETRINESDSQVRRRRECLACNGRYNTIEIVDLVAPRVIKSNQSREHFSDEKLKDGLIKALEKRPTTIEQIEAAIANIKHQIINKPEKEIQSTLIGELVMAELKKIDKVAYIRFASVYRDFKDVEEFRREIETLIKP